MESKGDADIEREAEKMTQSNTLPSREYGGI